MPISVNFDNSQGSIKARPENALFGLYQSCYVSSNEIHPMRSNFTCLYYKQSKAYTEDGRNIGSAFRICLLRSINRTIRAKKCRGIIKMALFECPECGGKVSDKATLCPHCGCPIEQPQSHGKVCPECGAKVEESAMLCPICSFPFSHIKGAGKSVFVGQQVYNTVDPYMSNGSMIPNYYKPSNGSSDFFRVILNIIVYIFLVLVVTILIYKLGMWAVENELI